MNGAPCAFLVHPTVNTACVTLPKKGIGPRQAPSITAHFRARDFHSHCHHAIRPARHDPAAHVVRAPWLRNLPFNIPDAALVAVALTVMAISVYITGLVAAHFFGRRLIRWGDRLLLRLPIVKPVYSASRQVVSIFASPSRTAFHAVALAEFPRKDSFSVGFITGTMIDPEGADVLHFYLRPIRQPGLLSCSPKMKPS